MTCTTQSHFVYYFPHLSLFFLQMGKTLLFLIIFPLITASDTSSSNSKNDESIPNYYIVVNSILVGLLLLLFLIAIIIIIKVKMSQNEQNRSLEEGHIANSSPSSSASGKRNRVSPARMDSTSVKTVNL